MATTPSYDLKVDRAEQHLAELEFEIRRYERSHPYALSESVENEHKVYRLGFTRQPDDQVALIVGDFLYNIHSALNHLAASMVPTSKQRRVNFPMLWQGVWDDPIDGESKDRRKARDRWKTYTSSMPSGAVEVLKREQPPDLGGEVDNTHALSVLNRLRNTDAHTKLTVVASTLVNPIVRYVGDGGPSGPLTDPTMSPMDGLPDGARLGGIPEGISGLEIEGTPKVVIRFGNLRDGIDVAAAFRVLLLDGTRAIVRLLRPFDRVNQ